MRDLRTAISVIENTLKENGVNKASYKVTETDKHEFNMAGGEFTLLRTTFESDANVCVFLGEKSGTASGNDFTDEGLKNTVMSAISSAESAEPDKDKDIAPNEGCDNMKAGALEPDENAFFARIRELQDTITKEYPTLKIGELIGTYSRRHNVYINTNGTEFETTIGDYEVFLSAAASDGERTTGSTYMSVLTDNLDKPIIEYDAMRDRLNITRDMLNVVPVEGKFTGSVILSPYVALYFADALVGNYCSDVTLIDNTSLWKDKLGQKVADERITLTMDETDPEIVDKDFFTSEGFRYKPLTIIENGVLKNFNINLYTANKTGRIPSHNCGMAYVMKNGEVSYKDMIKNVKKGILLGWLSGGEPSANGEFSGVAKSSFLIEDGKISGAVGEVMISGNLETMFNNVSAISKETITDGMTKFPYVTVEGITITGK